MNILVQAWNKFHLPQLQELSAIVQSSNKSIDQIFVFCHSTKDLELESIKKLPIKINVIPSHLSIWEKTTLLENQLRKDISRNDRLFVIMQEHTHCILQHLVCQICGSAFQEQTTFSAQSKFSSLSIPMNTQMNGNGRLFNHIKELIYSGNYRSCHLLLQNKVESHDLFQLVRFGDRLFHMDFSFDGKNGDIHPLILLKEKMEIEKIGTKEELQFLDELFPLENGDQKAFLYFLYNYAEFLYQERDMIDFIVIFYRIVEEAFLYALGWDVNDDSEFFYRKEAKYKLPFPDWTLTKHFYRYDKALRNYIRNLESKKNVKIRMDKQRGLEKLTDKERYFVRLYFFAKNKALNRCLDFRHEGVGGHGFLNLTREELETICGGQTPLELIDPFLEEQQLKPKFSIFSILNKVILSVLSKEFGE